MNQDSVVQFQNPDEVSDPLTELLQSGAKRLIQQAVEAELGELLNQYSDQTDSRGGPRSYATAFFPSGRL